ncbi:glutamate receptor ionotropic, kainate 2-like [Bombyx mandarina]|uniref:Glutamate receptor ionotropic, kainate 2-like n=1 Tax=Bombyx mandarina TaxID=7092 RepID=A0A6J2JUR7_BOMMA|nr:glutamate receptor ionotropic, kainate 2-like [Bombyx mandarina]
MWLLLICVCLIQRGYAQIRYTETIEVSFQIAGIFDRNAITHQQAFNETVHHVHLSSVRLHAIMLQPPRTDSYSVWRSLCSNTAMRPVAVFGPQNPISDKAVRDQCAIANIPHIQATMKPLDPDLELNEELDSSNSQIETADEAAAFKKITINFYPESDEISVAYGKLLNFYNWKVFAVLYEDDFGLLRIQKILGRHSDDYPVTVYRLDPEGDNRSIFKLLNEDREDRILLDCHVDRVMKYMEEAGSFKNLSNYQHYILVTLDAATIYDKLINLPLNVTWLSLTEFEKIKDAQHYLATRVGKWSNDFSTKVNQMKTDELVMDDITNHVVKAMETIEDLRKPDFPICEKDPHPWPHGAQLQKAILQTKTVGVTGNIEFNENGKRINYVLFVNEIYMSQRYTIGKWDSSNATEIVETRQTDNRTTAQQSKHFIVISRRNKPYFYEKEPCKEGDTTCVNDKEKYEGFSVDLVKAIFEILKSENFNYTYSFFHDEDKDYGEYDVKTKKWNGLIGDLLDKKADLAVCDLTITEDRKKIVDFSVPFMSLGISILFKKQLAEPPGMFSFLNPYSVGVWLYTATAYCVVSMVLFVCSRISPADWENPEPCEKNPEELENIWTFKNCAWLTMGSIMTQGCDILPKAIGTRWVCGMWWFFSMIVCQTYIAQLSASMTTALENESIKSVEDLAAQNKILYGAIKGGSTVDFFKNSKDKTFRRMYETMNSNPALLVKSNDEGVRRVLSGSNKYAFFMESSAIEYKLRRDCRLKKIGGELDNKYYGIAMPANSPFRTHINRAILKLQESTKLDKIRNLWWLQKYDAKICKDVDVDANDVQGDLELENLLGAFVVLIVGIFFSLIVTAIEFMNEVRNIVVRENVTHKEVLVKELKASLNFFNKQKPVLRNPSRAPSLAGTEESEDKNKEKKQKKEKSIENFMDFEKGASMNN